jgi:hypothetical protein
MQIKEGTTLDVSIPAAAGGAGTECSKGIQEKKIGSDQVLLLPWVGNGINYTDTAGRDVLSGPFTGCIMAVYKRAGARRVCHVATPECKEAWAQVKGETEVFKEFKPSDLLPAGIEKSLKGGLVILGYVTADDRCFALFCDRDKTGTAMKVLRVVAAK